MNKEIIQRVKLVSNYILETKQTIRNTAREFGVSKSTVHKDIAERLKELDIYKYNQIEIILKEHIQVRHILGGQSTRIKYQQMKENSGG